MNAKLHNAEDMAISKHMNDYCHVSLLLHQANKQVKYCPIQLLHIYSEGYNKLLKKEKLLSFSFQMFRQY
uniref:Uncharacterized protein n=1 Tax=Anguilla anguilla TaxID=7936 RepID=A0A0E9WNR0_ANGAN